MKIIFLDIDGVLNNMDFYVTTQMEEGPFDERSIRCLTKLVKASGAKIVLTSSWRGGWDPDPHKCNEEGRILNEMFHKEGMAIMAKTESLSISDGSVRSKEIKSFMKQCKNPIDAFVILDDNDYQWKKNGLYDHWVQTDFMKEGLSEAHIPKALEILKKKPGLLSKMKCLLSS